MENESLKELIIKLNENFANKAFQHGRTQFTSVGGEKGIY